MSNLATNREYVQYSGVDIRKLLLDLDRCTWWTGHRADGTCVDLGIHSPLEDDSQVDYFNGQIGHVSFKYPYQALAQAMPIDAHWLKNIGAHMTPEELAEECDATIARLETARDFFRRLSD